MGTDVTPAHISGALVIPDPRISTTTYAASLSSSTVAGTEPLTQAGPLPGLFEPQQDSELVLEAVGSRSADQVLEVYTQRGGHPEPDGATFLHRPASSGDWYGWDPPISLTGFEFVDRSTSANRWTQFHAIAGEDRRVHVVCVQAQSVVYCWTRDSAGVWTSASIFNKGSAYTHGAYPTIVRLPSGKLLCFYWRERSGSYTLRMSYSTDHGATWTTGQRSCLLTGSTVDTGTYTPGRLRVAHLNNQILLVASITATNDQQLWQYASNDLGATFSRIATLTGTDRICPDVIAWGGRFYVAYVKVGTPPRPHVMRLGSAYEPFDSATETDATATVDLAEWGRHNGTLFLAGDLSLVADEDGCLYLFGRDHDSAGGALEEVICARSTDGGDEWSNPGRGHSSNQAYSNAIWYGRDAALYPKDFSVCLQGGRMLMAHRAASLTVADSFMVAYLGGYTTLCLPAQSAVADPEIDGQIGWETTWLPYGRPDQQGTALYARVTAGTPTTALSDKGLRVQHGGASDSEQWTLNLSNSLSNGGITLLEIEVDAGQANTTLVISDGVGTSYTVRLDITPIALTLVDVNAAATIGSLSISAAILGIQVLLAMRVTGGVKSVRACYRLVSASGPARAWTEIAAGSTLTSGITTQASVSFSTPAGHAATDAYFKLHAATSGSYVGDHLSVAPSTDDLLGRGYYTSPVYVTDGLSLYAVDGPTHRAEEFHESTRYVYGIENLHALSVASPRRVWRSTNTERHEIAWEIGESNSDVHAWMERLYGLYLGGINWKTGTLYGRSTTGTWNAIAVLNAGGGMVSLSWVRAGALVVPGGGATGADRYLTQHSLAGSTVALDASVRRKIRTNTSGAWPTTLNGTRDVRLLLDTYDTGDPSSGSSGEIWSKDVLLLIPNISSYSAIKLRIDEQDTADGYLEVAKVVFGPVVVMRTSSGRAVGVDPSYRLTTGEGGTRDVQTLSPPRRWVEFDHADGVVATSIAGVIPSPNFIRAHTAGGGPIIAAPADSLYTLLGAYNYLGGAEVPVVYIDGWSVPSSSSALTINNRERFFYGRIVSEGGGFDNVLGDEWRNEYKRGRRLRIEEEL